MGSANQGSSDTHPHPVPLLSTPELGFLFVGLKTIRITEE